MNRIVKIILYFLGVLLALMLILFIYIVQSGKVDEPEVADMSAMELQPQMLDATCSTIGNNWIRKSESGLWEMYIEGKPFERGVVNGKLSQQLVHEQEEAFSERINELVPSAFYRKFLIYMIGWFNRDLDQNLTEESKLEIYGVSRSASHEFDWVGPAYQRMMNYHAAHDIGHALQNLALVGCSSFATWNSRSENNRLLIGRNFDFYVGDRFAKNKIVLFVNPDKGNKFMMVTWGGMTGVVSGMNTKGLTITLNAAKSELPSGSATPVSLLAREILQYAGNIQEAIEIASTKKVFVSETFLIGSAADNKAVSIELTPDTLAVYDPGNNQIICTNHFESDLLGNTPFNKKHMEESASLYRYNRIAELLDTVQQNTPEITASILRNQSGLHDKFIGYGNEKAVNQLICHHSIIFDPAQLTVWISTDPWQLGKYVAYHLDSVFMMKGLSSDHELTDTLLTIPADPFLNSQGFLNFTAFRQLKNEIEKKHEIDPYALITFNPEFYHSYVLAGNYLFDRKKYKDAQKVYEGALNKEIATVAEQHYIEEQIRKCIKQTGGN